MTDWSPEPTAVAARRAGADADTHDLVLHPRGVFDTRNPEECDRLLASLAAARAAGVEMDQVQLPTPAAVYHLFTVTPPGKRPYVLLLAAAMVPATVLGASLVHGRDVAREFECHPGQIP